MFKRRAFYMWPFFLGCWYETIGYLLRYINAKQGLHDNVTALEICTILPILLGPSFMAAYLQTAEMASPVLKTGYLLQVTGLVCFLSLALITRRRANIGSVVDAKWTGCLNVLFVSGAFILVRSIYRCLEVFVASTTELGFPRFPLLEHEYLFYIFDTCVILPVAYIFVAFHPSRYIQAPSEATKARRGRSNSDTSSFGSTSNMRSDRDSGAGSGRRCNSVDMAHARPWSFDGRVMENRRSTVITIYGTAM
ncbi:hypothetical protein RQP46_008942 [Phenoliferia psychrophenolica]